MKHSSLVLVLQRSASELWNLLFLTRWHLSLQCLVDTSTFHILWEQTLGIMRASLYIWWSMICTFVSHRILIIKCSQFISLNCWVALAFIPTKVGFFVLQCGRDAFFPLTFLKCRFFTAMQKVEVKFAYMFHCNGELVWVIYDDIINSLGPIRISFLRWV